MDDRMQGIQSEERAENRTMVPGYQPSDAQSSPRLAKLLFYTRSGSGNGSGSDEFQGFPLGFMSVPVNTVQNY